MYATENKPPMASSACKWSSFPEKTCELWRLQEDEIVLESGEVRFDVLKLLTQCILVVGATHRIQEKLLVIGTIVLHVVLLCPTTTDPVDWL